MSVSHDKCMITLLHFKNIAIIEVVNLRQAMKFLQEHQSYFLSLLATSGRGQVPIDSPQTDTSHYCRKICEDCHKSLEGENFNQFKGTVGDFVQRTSGKNHKTLSGNVQSMQSAYVVLLDEANFLSSLFHASR